MKSLKRTLCLVLALVMVLGLFGIASATSFTDDNSIQYKEAVDVITGIGAINGMGDGSFNPKGTITRAQAATMVARVALTAGVAADLTGIESSFSDVTVEGGYSWAIPSIEYMVKEGIINGMGDGTFNPNGEINGYAVLKMLLCVLGYGKQDEYVGHQWTLQVAIDANNNNLTDGRAKDASALSAPATREEVALYCYNALGAELVAYNRLLDRYEKSGSSVYDDEKQTTLADEIYGIKVAEGVVTANQATVAANATGNFTTVNVYDAESTSYVDTKFNIATGAELVGHYVKVYYKNAYTSAAVPGTTYSVVDASTVVNVAKNIDTTAKWNAAFGTATITNTRTSNSYSVTNGTASAGTISGLTLTSGTEAANAGTYILNKNDIVAYIAPATYKATVVSAYTAPTASATGSLTVEDSSIGTTGTITIPKVGDTTSDVAKAFALWNIYDGVAVGDVVTVAATGAFQTMTKATTATSTVTAFNTAVDGTLSVVAGATYAKAGSYVAATSATLSTNVDFTSAATMNKEVTFYLGPDGKVVAIVPVDDAADAGLVYVVSAYTDTVAGSYGSNTYLNKIQGVTMTGEEVNYIVGVAKNDAGAALDSNAIGIDKTAATALKGFIVSVATTYNDTIKTDLATLTKAEDLATNSHTTNAANVSGGVATGVAVTEKKIADNNYYDANTQFIFVTGEGAAMKVTALTAPQAIANSVNFTYYSTKATDAETNYTVKYVVVAGTPSANASSGLMFVPQAFTGANTASYTDANGKPATALVNIAFVDGTPNTAVLTKTVKDSDGADITTGFYTFSIDAQGIYSLKPAETGVDMAVVTNVYGNLLTTSNATGTDLDDDDASGAFIVDVPYLSDLLLYNGANNLENHTTLASLKGGSIAFSYTTTATGKAVTGIYYLGAAPQSSSHTHSYAWKVADASDATASNNTVTAGQHVQLCSGAGVCDAKYKGAHGANFETCSGTSGDNHSSDPQTLNCQESGCTITSQCTTNHQ